MNYKNKEWLHNQYIIEDKLLTTISKECNKANSTIWNYIVKFNLIKSKINRYTESGQKICSECTIALDISCFDKKPDTADGLQNMCKICFPIKYKLQRKTYRSDINNKIILNKRSSEWLKNNRVKANINTYKFRQTVKNNIDYKITNATRGAINASLKTLKAGRHWETLVGYTIHDLKNHLESLFEYWMNWDNYGKASRIKLTWQIDHILPISSFNIISAECDDFKQCWSLKNLRPLNAIENISKGKKILL